MKILVCEDDPMVLKAVEFKLSKEGCELIGIKDGKDALDFLAANDVDLIITDMLMPYVSGLEIINHVRTVLKKNTPIIVLSKIGAEDSILEAFKLGADDYITKPFSPNELLVRTRRLLLKK